MKRDGMTLIFLHHNVTSYATNKQYLPSFQSRLEQLNPVSAVSNDILLGVNHHHHYRLLKQQSLLRTVDFFSTRRRKADVAMTMMVFHAAAKVFSEQKH